MSQYRAGQNLKVTKAIQRSTGAAWPGDRVKVVAVEGDGLKIRMDNGTILDLVKDHEVEPG